MPRLLAWMKPYRNGLGPRKGLLLVWTRVLLSSSVCSDRTAAGRPGRALKGLQRQERHPFPLSDLCVVAKIKHNNFEMKNKRK